MQAVTIAAVKQLQEEVAVFDEVTKREAQIGIYQDLKSRKKSIN